MPKTISRNDAIEKATTILSQIVSKGLSANIAIKEKRITVTSVKDYKTVVNAFPFFDIDFELGSPYAQHNISFE
jgi:hypothetical protein